MACHDTPFKHLLGQVIITCSRYQRKAITTSTNSDLLLTAILMTMSKLSNNCLTRRTRGYQLLMNRDGISESRREETILEGQHQSLDQMKWMINKEVARQLLIE